MIVTRFAPSPTGYLHIGGARTALFCWLLARHEGGRMILRIEDTDQKRNTPTATQQVIEDLRWLGIDWDEGPEVEGPRGPYFQAQRLEIYQRYVKQLMEAGRAYYCFDTPEEIDVLRQEAVAQKQTFIYPRPEVFPDEAAAEQARQEGRPVTVRFVVPRDEPIVVEDVVRGSVTFDAGAISDFIIVKNDGYPTYHFACVVDDELMEVTHVIRGQEHLMNTPNHMMLQRALGFGTPTYAHMSVTVSEGGGKLSKRERAKTLLKAMEELEAEELEQAAVAGGLTMADLSSFVEGKMTPDGPAITAMAEHLGLHLPEINVVDFLRSGYVPEALVNFVALLGWNPGGNREIMTREELIEAFDLKRLNKTNSLFDRQKLVAFNMEHMKMLKAERLLEHFKRYLEVTGHGLQELDDATLGHMLQCSAGAQTLEQVAAKCEFVIKDEQQIEYDPKAVKKVLQKGNAVELLGLTREALAELKEWDEAGLNGVIERLCAEHEVGMGKIAQPIRVAITGSTVSPPIHDSLILLGRERTLARIDRCLGYVKRLD